MNHSSWRSAIAALAIVATGCVTGCAARSAATSTATDRVAHRGPATTGVQSSRSQTELAYPRRVALHLRPAQCPTHFVAPRFVRECALLTPTSITRSRERQLLRLDRRLARVRRDDHLAPRPVPVPTLQTATINP
jgi:hypothetical protein